MSGEHLQNRLLAKTKRVANRVENAWLRTSLSVRAVVVRGRRQSDATSWRRCASELRPYTIQGDSIGRQFDSPLRISQYDCFAIADEQCVIRRHGSLRV